ncbi:MAG TPA: ABC transporter permease [Gammaproteobacteria bacterium]|nr:ABC transporter permease [Gammaproteobacteria bacterium]
MRQSTGMSLAALMKKEWRLLLRDWHALLLLFVMPAAFILVMSLALQNAFARQQGISIDYYLANEDRGAASTALVERLNALPQFRAVRAAEPVTQLADRVRQGEVQFLVHIPAHFSDALQSSDPLPVEMAAGPNVAPALYQLFAAALREALGQVYLNQALEPLKEKVPGIEAKLNAVSIDKLLHATSLYSAGGSPQRPSAVQQNVPAWLLFAMFFIAIPLSTTWVAERHQGTYARLRSMGLRPGVMLAGKLLPYLAINLVQVALMLAVGVWVTPLLGGDSLTLGHAPLALSLMALASAFAAVAYGLLIANLASTSEQATIFTGVANLLMAAVGGVMVPRFLMPEAMQTLSQFSPMAWGLDGYLDVFLRNGGLAAVAPEAGWLFGFGFICLALAAWRPGFRRRK